MARATHGTREGAYYWECEVLTPEIDAGHVRVGWAQRSGELQAPVGYDKWSYAYRDLQGPSDVIGLAVFLQPPDAGTSSSEMPASEMPANHIRFFKNGRDQGIAFTDIPPGIYFPSL